ncbi:hypothetical protein KCMC57_up46980 [Kitasatospora sp. CMC57]
MELAAEPSLHRQHVLLENVVSGPVRTRATCVGDRAGHELGRDGDQGRTRDSDAARQPTGADGATNGVGHVYLSDQRAAHSSTANQ